MILPERYAYDFLKFCYRNPKSCPLFDVTEVGEFSFPKYGPGADIRTDVGEYYVYRDGVHVETRHDIKDLYRDDMVVFIIGCSFTFEHALLDADIPVRHILKKVIMCRCILRIFLLNKVVSSMVLQQ